MSAATIGVGSIAQGTVTLAAAPAAAASVTLTSSNPTVATVQSPVTIPAGSSTATFTVTGVAAGTASVTASLNGSSSQSPSLTVARVAVSTLSLSASTVVGGDSVTGTVGLTASAPVGGAAVDGDRRRSADRARDRHGAGGRDQRARSRSGRGWSAARSPERSPPATAAASASASVSVTKPTVATASFGITGPSETDTCTMSNGGNTLNCTFNGSTSTAPGHHRRLGLVVPRRHHAADHADDSTSASLDERRR